MSSGFPIFQLLPAPSSFYSRPAPVGSTTKAKTTWLPGASFYEALQVSASVFRVSLLPAPPHLGMFKTETHLGMYKAETHLGMYKAETHLFMFKAKTHLGMNRAETAGGGYFQGHQALANL